MSEADAGANGTPANDDGSDDQQWFELMAGRSAADVRPGTRNEAAWLRAALLAYAPAPPAGSMPEPAERVQRLLEKARLAGVLEASAPAPLPAAAAATRSRASRWAWLRQPLFVGGAGLAFAALLAVVVLRVAAPGTPPEADVERGANVQQLVVADPAARRQALLQVLRAAGLDAQPFERLGRLGVDIALPVPLPAAQAQALQQAGLKPPGGPALQVELTATAAAPAASVAPAAPVAPVAPAAPVAPVDRP